MTRKKIVLLALSAGVVIAVSLVALQGARAWWAWRGIERVEFNLDEARAALDADRDPEPTTGDAAPPPPGLLEDEYDTVLVIGSDARPADSLSSQEDAYADAVLLYLRPTDGSDPILVSLPRDLVVPNPCTDGETKLDRTLSGCGDMASGPELVSLAVEDFSGVAVDHFAVVGFEALVGAVDALGGVTICVDHALREGDTDLLAAGCSTVDGTTALRWVRSRQTQELVDGEWRFVAGAGDDDRTHRQQQLLLAMLGGLRSVRSPAALGSLAGEFGQSVVLDETLSMPNAVAMAWDLRSLSVARIRRPVVPVEPVVLEDGSFAVRATVPFLDVIAD